MSAVETEGYRRPHRGGDSIAELLASLEKPTATLSGDAPNELEIPIPGLGMKNQSMRHMRSITGLMLVAVILAGLAGYRSSDGPKVPSLARRQTAVPNRRHS